MCLLNYLTYLLANKLCLLFKPLAIWLFKPPWMVSACQSVGPSGWSDLVLCPWAPTYKQWMETSAGLNDGEAAAVVKE